jgi:hypothetical protein
MNTRYASIAVAAVLCLTAVSRSLAFTLNDLPYGFHVGTVTANSNGSLKIARGMDKADVMWVMHYHNCEEISPDIWAYSGFTADSDFANVRNCSIVVVRFAHNKVVDLQLVNRPAVTLIASSLKPGGPAKNLASK